MADLPAYQYLGNTLVTINDQFQQLNISTCNMLYSSVDWTSYTTTLNTMADRLNSMFTFVSNASAGWKSSSDMIANLHKYWMQPIMIMYPSTFNVTVDLETVSNWINAQTAYTLNPINFYEDQLLRVECLTKNYNTDIGLSGSRLYSDLFSTGVVAGSSSSIDKILERQEELSTEYNIPVHEVQSYLSLNNQIDLLVASVNSRILKYPDVDAIEGVAGLRSISSYIKFDGEFISNEWSNFSQNDLSQIYSLIDQFKTIDKIYAPLEIKVAAITSTDLLYFKSKNVWNNITHAFYFKRVDTSWVYWPDPFIDVCLNNNCNPCVDLIDINGQYTEDRDCPAQGLYVLIQCPASAVEQFPTPTLSALVTGNSIFTSYQGGFVDLNIAGNIGKYYVSSDYTNNYPASSYLLPGSYIFVGESDHQSCVPYDMGPLNISTPEVVDILSELFA